MRNASHASRSAFAQVRPYAPRRRELHKGDEVVGLEDKVVKRVLVKVVRLADVHAAGTARTQRRGKAEAEANVAEAHGRVGGAREALAPARRSS